MAVHDGCGGTVANPRQTPFPGLGKQAPMATVDLYNTTVLDTYKVAGAMYTELDSGIKTVVDALKDNQMWEDTGSMLLPLLETRAPLRSYLLYNQFPLSWKS